MRVILQIVLSTVVLAVAAAPCGSDETGAENSVPTVTANCGNCTASFEVTDGQQRPVAEANVSVYLLRAGPARKVHLYISTNAAGPDTGHAALQAE